MEPLANLDELSWQDARTFQMAGELLSVWRGDPKPAPSQLIEARVRCGLTRKQLAETFHISRMSVTRWERGSYRQRGEEHPMELPHWPMWYYRLRRVGEN